jgi:hypothetical protein
MLLPCAGAPLAILKAGDILVGNCFREGGLMKRKAMILCGGWDGHEPKLVTARFKKFLESEDFEVAVEENIQVLKDKERLGELDLFIPI